MLSAIPLRRSVCFTRTLATHASNSRAARTPTRSWAKEEIQAIYDAPLLNLVFRAASVHRQHHDPSKIQLCTLMNIKTGGCTEDCSYCSQSSRYDTPTKASRLVELESVLEAARKAKENGSTRFCMGAAWRDLAGRKRGFERILQMVREVRGMGMEVCTTLGMLSPEQARQLKEAGLTAYNHNLDTSREFYPQVITTRSYDERLDTISAVRDAGISVCSGGILGLGEADADRVGLIWEVANMPEHPESFPVNALVPIAGTPLEKNEPVPYHTLVRTIATARIVLPNTIIRLAAGRNTLAESEQAMCFMAGANAVFTGEQMLTTPCLPWDEDKAMMSRWGLEGMQSFQQPSVAKKEGSRLETLFWLVRFKGTIPHPQIPLLGTEYVYTEGPSLPYHVSFTYPHHDWLVVPTGL
ncbi:putative biotin and Thiamin Synthesis associated domain containing protein [Lyophyllum shimeji]|uniref:biotin synthase n=1 Tax=Lyophyllum shimeji TaxID=47721 RepID=A0A9P3PJD7_LYOSH|nr:putative biotin and Thiamin Synthesis associated domain containing protein [Lyophyllum shimeji]